MKLEEIKKELAKAKRIVKKDVKNGTVSPRTYFFDGRWSAFEELIKGHAPADPHGGGGAVNASAHTTEEWGRVLTLKKTGGVRNGAIL